VWSIANRPLVANHDTSVAQALLGLAVTAPQEARALDCDELPNPVYGLGWFSKSNANLRHGSEPSAI
jgi:hypothetical protein